MIIAKTQVGSNSYFAESELPIGRFKSRMKAKAIAMESAAPTIVISTHNTVLAVEGCCRPTDSQPNLSLRRTTNIKSAANAQMLSSLNTTFRAVHGMWVELTAGMQTILGKACGAVHERPIMSRGIRDGCCGHVEYLLCSVLAGGSHSNRPTLRIRFGGTHFTTNSQR